MAIHQTVHTGLLLVCAAAHGKGFLGVYKQSLPELANPDIGIGAEVVRKAMTKGWM